jgi:hypothetical protein
MKPVVLGLAQPYPGYSCEQVTIVASRILDTIVAFGQTRHNMLQTCMLHGQRNLNHHYSFLEYGKM